MNNCNVIRVTVDGLMKGVSVSRVSHPLCGIVIIIVVSFTFSSVFV
jgi:hypothetical protein